MNIQKYKFILTNSTELWKKELRHILKRDIHEKGLGCCVKNTHVKIGNVHLGEFFEAQFLFGNAYWISIFSNALKQEFEKIEYDKDKKILVVGYETYIEPVLLQLIELLKDDYNVNFCIYEEPKFIMKNQKSDTRLRISGVNDIKDYDDFFIVCGISSTLNTYRQIISKIATQKDGEFDKILNNSKCFSIIQVLPNEFENGEKKIYSLGTKIVDKLDFTLGSNSLTLVFGENDSKKLEAKYLVDVFCEWENAESCRWCFNEKEERPIITTNETSVIPVQMIGNMNTCSSNKDSKVSDDIKLNKINLFEKTENNKFLYRDYLYYNHIERDSHHFQYYVRTNSLLKAIVNNSAEKDKLISFCKQIRKILFKGKDENRVDVIVVPIHYSNEHFLNIVATEVFENSVEIINFDPQKEYRSNFETKYSNYAYIVEYSGNQTNIHFHFVDDQVITGNTYFHAKSFVSSLIRNTTNSFEKHRLNPNVKIFDSIITLLDRNSDSTKFNYLDDINNFFSLIDISIPSLRVHGDSCHLCSKSKNAELIKKKSALYTMSKFWEEKEEYHCVKTLDKTKQLRSKQDKKIWERKFRQFYCENLLWEKLKNNWTTDNEIFNELVTIIAAEIKLHKIKDQYEYIISFIKVMSKPFIYYRENIKKAVHALMIYLVYMLNINPDIRPSTMLRILKEVDYGEHAKVYVGIEKEIDMLTGNHLCKNCEEEKYYLYVMLLSRLCAINSNHLLKYSNIEKAIDFYNKIIENKNDAQIKPIEEFIAPLIKLVTNGISGEYKAKKLDEELEKIKNNSIGSEFIQRIYLENLEADNPTEANKEALISKELPTRRKYANILEKLIQNRFASFVVYQSKTKEWFTLSSIKTDKHDFNNYDNSVLDKDITFSQGMTFIKCYETDATGDKAFLVVESNSQQLSFSELKFIRSILNFRYILCEELEKDIFSGAIRELYQYDKWIDMLAQPKAVNHGQSEDFKEHLKNIENKFSLYKICESEKNMEFFTYYNVLSDLTLLANLLISFFHSKKIASEMDLTHKFSKQLEIIKINSIQKLDCSHSENDLSGDSFDFSEYSGELKEEKIHELFMSRFYYYLKCLGAENYLIKFEKETNQKIQKVASLNFTDENSIWFSIAIIHILIKNAIQHGDIQKEIVVYIRENEDSFDLEVKNEIAKDCLNTGKGITQKALQYAFQNKIKVNDDKVVYKVTIPNFFNGGEI